jgi:peptidylprolyl isomerase
MKYYAHSIVLIAVLGIFIGCNQSSTKDTKKTERKGSTMTRHKTPSGLEYEIVKEGAGESPQKGKKVTVHYTGWLNNNGELGKKFDSSVDRGEPFSFAIGVGYVIQGWDEGVMSMKVGEKRRLYIPAQLGYGSRGAGAVIPPNAHLIFDVELISVG